MKTKVPMKNYNKWLIENKLTGKRRSCVGCYYFRDCDRRNNYEIPYKNFKGFVCDEWTEKD